MVGLAPMGSGIVFAESSPASELAVWASLTIVSVVCWLGLRRSARQSSRRRWHPSSFEIGAIAAVIAFGAGLWLRGSPTSATLVAVATLILAAFSEEFSSSGGFLSTWFAVSVAAFGDTYWFP